MLLYQGRENPTLRIALLAALSWVKGIFTPSPLWVSFRISAESPVGGPHPFVTTSISCLFNGVRKAVEVRFFF
jgi:hypothetical protein